MSSTQAFSTGVIEALQSQPSSVVQAAGWAVVTALLAALIVRHRPQNSSFAWRALFTAACLWSAAQCAAEVLLATGDPITAMAIRELKSLFALLIVTGGLVSQYGYLWAGDRSEVVYARVVRERRRAAHLAETPE